MAQFPIPTADLPARLRDLLTPVSDHPQLRVDVATRYDFDQYGPKREYVHMVMALTQEPKSDCSNIKANARDGVVYFSKPCVEEQGGLPLFEPSVSGLDYVVASSGNGSFYSYNLSENVWMALGLSPRCYGGNDQKIVYDDLSLPEFAVAEGEISTEYYFSPKRNVHWTISNDYLRRYLWMRGAYGMRVFFYETLLPIKPEFRELMSGEPVVTLGKREDWYTLIIREHQGRLLIQVLAAVIAVPPERCPERSANGLVWPGLPQAMTHDRANYLTLPTRVYLDDRFLERYEQNSLFRMLPVKVYGRWLCSPSYAGQWTFASCRRVGRNMVTVPMRDLYDAKPDREILHAHAHALHPSIVAEFDQDEEHIVSKTQRLLDQLLDLGDSIEALCVSIGEIKRAEEIVGFSRAELKANGWLHYPQLCRLAQVAPLAMTEQAFLSRCKSIHELWQGISNRALRKLIVRAGHKRSNIKKLGSIKLLQVLSNIVQQLNAEGESVDAFQNDAVSGDVTDQNEAFAALFLNYELRNADAHDTTGEVFRHLEALGFESASLNQGYGRALDHVFDSVISTFAHLNAELDKLLHH